MTPIPNIVIFAGLLIGVIFGAVGLLSGFCLTSGLRNWWTQGDGRLVRSFALALAVAIAGTQSLAAHGLVDLSQSIYLQPTFSAPLMLFGGLMFGYGMVAANACASRALVLLGRGNLRSLVVVTTVGVTAEITLKGLIAPARLAVLHWSQTTLHDISVPALISAWGPSDSLARFLAVALDEWRAGDICIVACTVPAGQRPDRGGHGDRAFDPGRLVRHRQSRRRSVQSGAGGVADIRRADRRYAAICHAVNRIDAKLRHCRGGRCAARQLRHRARHAALRDRGL